MTNAEREAGLLSDRYYNEALNRARIRDLTGAAEKLRVSLQLNKKNVQARNLYGLVLYERGETVAALREWILSQNIQPAMNSASQYIRSVEKEASKLKQMSRGISDYNEALRNCQDGNDDVASLRLRRAIQKNPRLIDAQLLLALIIAILKDCIAYVFLMVLGGMIFRVNGVWAGIGLAPLFSMGISLLFISLRYGIKNFPLLLPEENSFVNDFDLILTEQNILGLRDKLEEILLKNQIHKKLISRITHLQT